MQQIVDVGMTPEEYVQCGGHERVEAPVGCPAPACGNTARLHRHMQYARDLSGLKERFWVKVFLCVWCHRTVSCLPSFALPYRYVRVSTVAAFFGGRLEDPEVQRHEHLLQRYRKDLERRLRPLVEVLGLYLGNRVLSSAKDFLTALGRKHADLKEAQRRLVIEFGMGLFGRYVCHGWARASVSGVGSLKRRVRWDSG